MQVEIKFTDNLEAAFTKLEALVGESALRSAGYAGAQVFQEEAKVRVPVDTGNLRDNIIVKRAEEKSDTNKRQTYLVRVRIGQRPKKGDERVVGQTGAFYWHFVEFGTSKMSARPYLRPSFDAKVQAALDAMRAKLAEKVAEGPAGSGDAP